MPAVDCVCGCGINIPKRLMPSRLARGVGLALALPSVARRCRVA